MASRIRRVHRMLLVTIILLTEWVPTPTTSTTAKTSVIPCHGFLLPTNSVPMSTTPTSTSDGSKNRSLKPNAQAATEVTNLSIRRLLAGPRREKFVLYSEIPRGGGTSVESNDDDNSQKLQGRGLLCLVALLYGTLNVSLRLIYQLPEPPSASVMSATRGWLATLCFLPLLLLNRTNQADQAAESTTTTTQQQQNKDVFVAGLELAIWNFLAQGLLNIGLLSTGSARASFLTQTSVVLTPMISLFAGQFVPSTVWVGCGIALVGLTLLSSGGGGAAAGAMSSMAFSQGDCLVLGGALSWSFYLFRLSKIGSKFNEINLQAVKTLLLAILYTGWVAYSWWSMGSGGAAFLASSLSWMTSLVAWATFFYSALGPGTLADVLQQQGQKSVSASEANILLSMEPVFAALCAQAFLGEVLSTMEISGGGLILVAALVATSSSGSDSETQE